MKVLWLTFIPSPYRLRFFEELGKKCELTVLFERENSKNRKSHWDNFQFEGYKGIILKGITIGGFDKFCPNVRAFLNSSYDVIVISNPTSPTGIYAAAILQSRHIPYIVESDGAFPTNKMGIKLAIKKFVMSHAKLCLSTAKLNDEYYIECGVKKENIRRYPFTSIGEKDIENAKRIMDNDKSYYKKKLGIAEKNMLLSVGRFSYEKGYGKGFDLLISIAQKIKELDVGIYIVGDEPTEEFIKLKEQNELDKVHYIGFKDQKELAEYYAAADLFILLTRGDVWGLVINEAMMFGLPVLTSDKCIAGLEMIQDEENGYIFTLDNIDLIVERIKELLSNQDLRNKMAENNIRKADEYTFEKMAEKHITLLGNMGGGIS